MRRYGKFFGILALGLAVLLPLADYAEARRAGGFGGFGSRGTRTYSAPPATNTAPTTAAPIQRSMTPQNQAARPANTPAGQQAGRGGMFGGLAGGLMGGLLLGGLFGMLMGTGFGGGFGFLGLLLQAALLFFAIRFAMRMFANRQQPAYAGGRDGQGGMARAGAAPDSNSRPLFEIPKMGSGAGNGAAGGLGGLAGGLGLGRGAGSANSGNPDELGITPTDLERFEVLLKEMQAAYAGEDYTSLRRICTPEAMSYLAEELGDNATRGQKNEVRDVRLLQGDVAESWNEDGRDYATVAMRFESVDYMVDRATGKVIDGNPEEIGESVELWTFVRRPGTDWQIAAIQSAPDAA